MLDDDYDSIEGVPDRVMMSLQQVGRHNVWHGFLPTLFEQWVKWKYKSTKWLAKELALYIEALHALWLERCRIGHECMISRIKVEDHYNLLC